MMRWIFPLLLVTSLFANSMERLCQDFNGRITEYNWGQIICKPSTWHWEKQYITLKGYPLVYNVFGNQDSNNTTLVFCAVHGDELPTAYLCVHLARDILFDHPEHYKDSKVIIAPLLNPDGFFANPPTRQNANGVDLNRNFPTKDFDTQALKQWKQKTKSNKRKYPGLVGGSEVETQFQMMLIERFKPDKLISIHSPYGWLDVDSPNKKNVLIGDEPDGYQFDSLLKRAHKTKLVAKEMSKRSNNYKVINFRVYPGSLGNYAAKERGIPTYTLELPTSDSNQAHSYWLWMAEALRYSIGQKIEENLEK